MKFSFLIITCVFFLIGSSQKHQDGRIHQPKSGSKLILQTTQTDEGSQNVHVQKFVYDQTERCIRIDETSYDTIAGVAKQDSSGCIFLYRENDKLPYKVRVKQFPGGERVCYIKYDALGRKIQDSMINLGPPAVTDYYYSGNLIIARQGSGDSSLKYFWTDTLYYDGKNISTFRGSKLLFLKQRITNFSYDDKNTPYKNLNIASSTLFGKSFDPCNYLYLNKNNVTKIQEGSAEVITYLIECKYDADGFPTLQFFHVEAGTLRLASWKRYQYSK